MTRRCRHCARVVQSPKHRRCHVCRALHPTWGVRKREATTRDRRKDSQFVDLSPRAIEVLLARAKRLRRWTAA